MVITSASDGPVEKLPEQSKVAVRGPDPRWIGPAAIVVAVLPIWVAAIRDGLRGLFPYADAAATVLRARDVFAGPFPLAGMKAAAATSGGYQSYFPGAWQLYAIALPTRVFGDIWGPLLAMAVLNTAWVALAGWLLLRRLRLAEALVGIAFLTMLLWSVGSGFLVTPVPMDMVVIPMALFLIAVWSVADGDLVAVPVLAVVANYLWLDHLVLVVTVPLVGLCAPIGLWLWVRREKRREAGRDTERNRRIRRSLIGAGLITAIMWLPTIIQQFTTSPGNLRVLVSSAGVDRPIIGSWSTSVHNVISVVARPPFWLRDTFSSPSYLRGALGPKLMGDLSVFDLAAGLLLVAAIVALGILAYRRKDRSGLWLLIVTVVALVLAVVTTYSAPTYYGPPTGYLRSLWPTAMFIWLALAVNVLRSVRGRLQWSVIVPVAALIVVLTALNLPVATYGYDTDQRTIAMVKNMNDSVVPRFLGDEPVMLSTGLGFSSHRFGAALMLALASAGVDYCVPDRDLLSDGSLPRCPTGVSTVVDLRVTSDPASAPAGEVLVRESYLSRAERMELAHLEHVVGRWLESHDHLTLSTAAERRMKTYLTPEQQSQVRKLLKPDGGDLAPLRTDPVFRGLIQLWDREQAGSETPIPLFTDSPLDLGEWRRLMELSERDLTLVVTKAQLDQRR